MAVGKVAAQLCLTLIVKELKISVERSRVVITLNTLFSVVTCDHDRYFLRFYIGGEMNGSPTLFYIRFTQGN